MLAAGLFTVASTPALASHSPLKRIGARLGPEGFVEIDPDNGGIRSLGSSGGLLTAPAPGDPAEIALDYVRSHEGIVGLDAGDLSALQLAARYRSPDGVTHLTWQQTDRGIPSYDTFLSVNVARDGALVNLTGSPVHDLSIPSAKPGLSRTAGAAAASNAVNPGSTAEPAGLVILAEQAGDELARRFTVEDPGGREYDVVVDASSGDVLARHSLTSDVANASVYENHPGAAAGGAAHTVDLEADPNWLNASASSTQLSGRNAHAYADVNGTDGVQAGEDVGASSGNDWLYPQTSVGCGASQIASSFSGICTWDGVNRAATEPTNRKQATTQLFYFVNTYHDWLAQSPIGFTDASHNFESAGTGGSDPLNAEADDSGSVNNANMSTGPDGTSPRMQMYLWKSSFPAVNGSDDASVVYHEYTHGLSTRLVGNGTALGLVSNQARAMGEGWSDWYGIDYLLAHGLETDTPGTADVAMGEYVTNDSNVGTRLNAIDCPVGSVDATHCPGTTLAGSGGFTLGDMGHVVNYGGSPPSPHFEVHADGEIWVETLWDLRSAVGATTARGLITDAMRLSPNGPSFLDMRDAILEADVVGGGAHHAEIWQVFANRGMGFSASTGSGDATRAREAFDTPPLVSAGSLGVSDAASLGDGDGNAEPGETVKLTVPLRNPGTNDLTSVTGTLTSSTPGVFIGEPSVDYGTIGDGATKTPAAKYAITIPTSTACSTDIALSLDVHTGDGPTTLPLTLTQGALATTYTSSDVPKSIPDASVPGATSTLNIPDTGTVGRIRVGVQTNHTWIGDLHGILTSPTGRTVQLFERPGKSGTTSFGSALNGFNVLFDDGAASSIQDLASANGVDSSSPGPTGPIRPDEALSKLSGDQLNGTWTLRMFDAVAGATGSIQAFSIQAGPPACSTTVTPPDATTTTAGSVTHSAATLNGTIDANDIGTNYAFQYGTTQSYGQTTSTQSAGSSPNATPVSASVSGLSPDTDYHFRVIAIRSGTIVAVGGDQTFHTVALPDATTSTADSVTHSAATLNGTINPHGLATDYAFEYGTTQTYGQTTSTQSAGSGGGATPVSVSVSSLSPNTDYHFRVVALRGGTVLAVGADKTFHTAALPGATTSTADSVSTSGATLNGTIDPHGVATDYAFEYGTTQSYGQTTSTQSAGSGTGGTAVSVSVSSLSPDMDYHFRVVALRGGTVLAAGADKTFHTASLPALPPDTEIEKATINSKKRTASFSFGAVGQATSFECALAKKGGQLVFAACQSPKKFKKLKLSKYTFEARSIGPGGTDASPAQKQFKIK